MTSAVIMVGVPSVICPSPHLSHPFVGRRYCRLLCRDPFVLFLQPVYDLFMALLREGKFRRLEHFALFHAVFSLPQKDLYLAALQRVAGHLVHHGGGLDEKAHLPKAAVKGVAVDPAMEICDIKSG